MNVLICESVAGNRNMAFMNSSSTDATVCKEAVHAKKEEAPVYIYDPYANIKSVSIGIIIQIIIQIICADLTIYS